MAYGQIDSDKINTSVANTSLGAGNATRFKNRIINGDMRIDQRNAGASLTIPSTSSQFTVDRWTINASQASKLTAQQNAGAVTPPAGFTNYLGVTSSSAYSLASSDYFQLLQSIEGLNVADLGWGTANAKTVTLSAWVYSSLTGTFGGAVINNAGNRCYPFSYTISSANTWTQISITIAGDTTGTWLTTNGIGIQVRFSLGMGSTYTGGTAGAWTTSLIYPNSNSIVSTNGATFYITGVQLEVGSSATGFEYVDYTTQLLMCQRYFYSSYTTGLVANSGDIIAGHIQAIGVDNTSAVTQNGTFAVPMRATPTCNVYTALGGAGTGSMRNHSTGGTTVTGVSIAGASNKGLGYVSKSGSLTLGHFYGMELTADAEL